MPEGKGTQPGVFGRHLCAVCHPAQAEVTVAGIHFVQVHSPDEIGRPIAG
jgi:hypothetical protein